MSLSDSLIGFATIIFVMSTISERVANFLKLYFQDKIIYIPVIPHKAGNKWLFFMEARISILAQSQITQAAEKEREYRVLVINIIVGILSAALINLNIFEVLEYVGDTNTTLNIGWTLTDLKQGRIIFGVVYLFLFIWSGSLILFSKLQEQKKYISEKYVYSPFYIWLAFSLVLIVASTAGHYGEKQILLHFVGYVSVGVFLSLGSKFWHDLLDILFSFKRTQEKLSDPKLLTDFTSADQIIKYTEISQYNIAEQLYDKYRSKVWAIKGVVSCGLVTYFNERIKLYQKRIEVEFTNSDAQKELLNLKAEGEVQINYNTFYLKDFIEIMHTTALIALPHAGVGDPPVCYARNKANMYTRGSFGVKKSGDKFIAYSCLHVLAADSDFAGFMNDENASLSPNCLEIEFCIDGVTLNGTINPDSVMFGNKGGGYYGADYCECEIDGVIYNKYNDFIQSYHLEDFPDGKMKMFGATSKLLNLKNPLSNIVTAKVHYGENFYKDMELYKIDPENLNVSPGDSGSAVYFREEGSSKLCIGMIVSKSDSNAYMFKLWTLGISDSCKTT